MAIINFSIPKILEQRVKQTMQKKGFPSKAELFRFAVIHYLDETERLPLKNNQKIADLSEKLGHELKRKMGSKSLPSVREQLKK